MLLQSLVTILLLQDGVLPATLRHSRSNKEGNSEEKDNNINESVDEEDNSIFSGPRRLGSWLTGTFLPDFSEKKATSRKSRHKSEPKVTVNEIIEYLGDGLSKFKRVINDPETMDYAVSLYNRDWQGWMDVIFNKDVKNWCNSLVATIKKAIANYIVNSKIDQIPVVSTLRSGLKALSPIIGGDPSKAVVSSLVNLLA